MSQRLQPQNTHGGKIARSKALDEQFARILNELDNILLRLDSLESIIQETTFELSRVSDRRDKILENIQQALLLIYGQQINTPAAKKLFNTIQISQDAIFLMRTIAEETKNLQMLKEREARRGGRDYLSVGDIRDIEETELRIERLRQELHELERLSKPGL